MALTLQEFLGFFQQDWSQPVELNIIIPYHGQPLPSIIMKLSASAPLDAKMVITQELATGFMEYLRGSRGGVEVSN